MFSLQPRKNVAYFCTKAELAQIEKPKINSFNNYVYSSITHDLTKQEF